MVLKAPKETLARKARRVMLGPLVPKAPKENREIQARKGAGAQLAHKARRVSKALKVILARKVLPEVTARMVQTVTPLWRALITTPPPTRPKW